MTLFDLCCAARVRTPHGFPGFARRRHTYKLERRARPFRTGLGRIDLLQISSHTVTLQRSLPKRLVRAARIHEEKRSLLMKACARLGIYRMNQNSVVGQSQMPHELLVPSPDKGYIVARNDSCVPAIDQSPFVETHQKPASCDCSLY